MSDKDAEAYRRERAAAYARDNADTSTVRTQIAEVPSGSARVVAISTVRNDLGLAVEVSILGVKEGSKERSERGRV